MDAKTELTKATKGCYKIIEDISPYSLGRFLFRKMSMSTFLACEALSINNTDRVKIPRDKLGNMLRDGSSVLRWTHPREAMECTLCLSAFARVIRIPLVLLELFRLQMAH